MGMTKTSDLFEKLSKSGNMTTVTLCEEAQTLYISVLKGYIGPDEIQPYIAEHRLIERVPESDKEDFVKLLELITMLGSVQ